MSEHTMQQDMENFQASGAGFKGADLSPGLIAQMRPDRHKPRIGTEDHEAHIKTKSDQIEAARKQLEDAISNPAHTEAAATTVDGTHDHDPTYSPTGIPIRKAESSMAQNSSSTSAEATEPTSNPDQSLVVRKAASSEKANQTTASDSKPVVIIGSEGQSRKLESSAVDSSETSQSSPNIETSPSVTEPTPTVSDSKPSPEKVKQPFVPVAGSIEEPEPAISAPEVSSTSSEPDDTTTRSEQGAPEPERLKVEQFKISSSTEKNFGKSEDNQDVILEDSNKGLMAVFDGMGGHAAGREAAETAKRVFEASFSTDEFKGPSEESKQKYGDVPSAYAVEEMTRALERADREIKDSGTGGGTTAAAVICFKNAEGQTKAVIGHVGDSRVYRLSPDGKLEHLTLDDSEAIETLVKQRGMTHQEAQQFLASTDERKDIPSNLNEITNALGSDGMKPHVGVVDVNPGDIIFATSDGIHDNLTDREIQAIIEGSPNPQEAVARLIQNAGETSKADIARSKDDDRSVVMMGELGGGESDQAEESTISRPGTESGVDEQAGNHPESSEYERQYLTLPDGTKVYDTPVRRDALKSWKTKTLEQQESLKQQYLENDKQFNREYHDPSLPLESEDTGSAATKPTPEVMPTSTEASTPDPIILDSESPTDEKGTAPGGAFVAGESGSYPDVPETPNPPPDSGPETPPQGDGTDRPEAPPQGNDTNPEGTEHNSNPEPQRVQWETHIETVKQELAKIHDALGKAFRAGMNAFGEFAGTVNELSVKKIPDSYQNWRNNGRRRSENYRERMTRDGRPDTKWQRIRLGMIERSEQRRAAFWDKWLGTRIGLQEDERPSGQEGRQRLINRPEPEESMDRAVRLLANLRNDQERFRGIGLRLGREKVRQIEDDFRDHASQEVADKVEEKLTERAQYSRAAQVIRENIARSAEDSHIDGEALDEYVQQIQQAVASKGEFNSMIGRANQYFENDDRVAAIAVLDSIKALNDAHEAEEIDDATILKVNQLVYEGKDSDDVIRELESAVSPAEIQAVAVSSILDIMQKVDQAQAETKSTRRKNDGKIHQILSSPGWKKTTGTVIAGAGTLGMLFTGPAGAVVAGAGIFMARQAGMRERVENTTNKKAGQQADLIDRMTEDPLMRELYRRLDVTPHTQGGEVGDLPIREHIDREDIENFNARELAEALGGVESISGVERRYEVTLQIIDSLLRTSHDRARTKLMRRAKSTAYSAGASTLPVAATIGSLGGLFAGYFIALSSVGVPLFGAWRGRRQYAPPSPPS